MARPAVGELGRVLAPAAVPRLWLFVALCGPLILYALWGIARVPFHPDESSWLFMSRDFEHYLSAPWSLAWQPELEGDPALAYRELNAPASVYLLGLARRLAGYPPGSVAVDWDWALSWEANTRQGALPDPALLWSARLGVTLLLPLSLALIYRVGRAVAGEAGGLSAAVLLGTHSLVLLHGRRAMAEGALVLGIVIGLWGLLQAGRRPWLAGLAAGLAFSSKQSALALFPAGVIAVLWTAPRSGRSATSRAGALAQYLLAFGGIVLLLHPLLWARPAGAVTAMLRARDVLLAEQTRAIESVSPGYTLTTAGERLAALVAHVFLAPPAYAELANYAAATAPAEARYAELPAHNWLRGLTGGLPLMVLALFGFGLAARDALRGTREQRRRLGLLALAAAAQAGLLLAAIPLPFQRYYLPLIPFACLWAGYAVSRLGRLALTPKGWQP